MTVNGGGDWNDPGHFMEPILPELLEGPVGSLTDGEQQCGPALAPAVSHRDREAQSELLPQTCLRRMAC